MGGIGVAGVCVSAGLDTPEQAKVDLQFPPKSPEEISILSLKTNMHSISVQIAKRIQSYLQLLLHSTKHQLLFSHKYSPSPANSWIVPAKGLKQVESTN